MNLKILLRFLPAFLWLVFIVVACLMPGDDLPVGKLFAIPHFDKVVHFGMYFVLAILLVFPFQSVRLPVGWSLLLATLLIGGAIEILQFLVTSERSASWGDLAADMAGAMAGWPAFFLLLRIFPRIKSLLY